MAHKQHKIPVKQEQKLQQRIYVSGIWYNKLFKKYNKHFVKNIQNGRIFPNECSISFPKFKR